MKKTRKNCKWWRGNSILRKSMRNKIVLAILIILAVLFGWLAFRNTEAKEYISLEECFYYQPNIPYVPTTYILGTLVDEELYRIINCESGFDPDVCNADYGCGSGIGLGQLTAGAIKDCEKGLEKIIDPYNGEDNLECSLWLYENYGTSPWGCPDCWWGSYDCWKRLTK